MLQGVTLQLRAGELLHVWGPNGAGKSTLLRVVCGLLRPEQGSVLWAGRSIADDPVAYHLALAYASHEPALKADLTALENLRFAVGLKRRVADTELRSALGETGVAACADLPARVLSAGQRRRVALARVLVVRADLWLLDEPYTNLDASGAQLLSSLLERHLAAGGSALIVAHQELVLRGPVRRLELAT